MMHAVEPAMGVEAPPSLSLDEWRRQLDQRKANGAADALAAADEALADYPAVADLHAFRGEQLFLVRRFDEAEAALQRALELGGSSKHLLHLALVYVVQGRCEEASSLVERAVADGRSAHVLRRAGSVLAQIGDYQGAAHLLAEAIALSPHRAVIEEHDQVLANLDRDARAGVSALDKPLYRRALEHLRLCEPRAAETLFAALARRCPDFAPAWIGLRGALEAQHRPGEAEAVAQAWVTASPGVSPAMVGLAMSRPLGGRGFVFDPNDRFPFLRAEQSLTPVATAQALKARDDAVLVIDPGGDLVEQDPVISLDGRGDDKVMVRYRTAPKFVAALANAAITGDGAVLTQRGEIIEELNGERPARYGGRRDGDSIVFDRFRHADGVRAVRCFDTPAFLMAGPTDTSFGDWIVNFAPRLALAEAAGLDYPIVVRSDPPAQVLDLLGALGVSREQILFHDPQTVSLFSKLYAPSWPSRDKVQPTAGVFDIYRRAALQAGRGERRRLYLTRRSVVARPMVNETEVCELFSRRGFQIVDPASLTFDQVRELFADAVCVAGGFGSAFHNLCFCARKPVNLVILPPHRQVHLAEIALWHADHGMRFGYVRGESLPGARPGLDPRRAPWRAPLDQLDRALDQILELAAHND